MEKRAAAEHQLLQPLFSAEIFRRVSERRMEDRDSGMRTADPRARVRKLYVVFPAGDGKYNIQQSGETAYTGYSAPRGAGDTISRAFGHPWQGGKSHATVDPMDWMLAFIFPALPVGLHSGHTPSDTDRSGSAGPYCTWYPRIPASSPLSVLRCR